MRLVAWWSAGITSAVACKLALEIYGNDNVDIVYFHIDSAHMDNHRFKRDCEEWYGKAIHSVSGKYSDQFDVIESTRYINGPTGAKCTSELKKSLRLKIQRENQYDGQIFGFEFSKKEVNRAIRFKEQHPETNPIFPLIEFKKTKEDCLSIVNTKGIEIPEMYKLGYPNNNCIGCVKGGKGYWNKIRSDFPDYFNQMVELERYIGRSCINGTYLDELDPNEGRNKPIKMPDCGSMCDIKYTDIMHPDVIKLFKV